MKEGNLWVLLFGATAGFVSSALFQPFQILKLAYILHWDKAPSFKGIIHFVILTEGYIGFWKGLAPTSIRSALGAGIYFSILRALQTKNTQFKSSLIDAFNSTVARVLNSILLNPLTILQLRSQIPGNSSYENMAKGIRSIANEYGMRSFTHGIIPILWKEGIFAAIFYALYKKSKELSTSKIVGGLVSGIVATVASHPFQLIRTRAQAGQKFEKQVGARQGLLRGLKKIYKSEGIHGLWRGIQMRIIKKPLVNTATFVIFEVIEKRNNNVSCNIRL